MTSSGPSLKELYSLHQEKRDQQKKKSEILEKSLVERTERVSSGLMDQINFSVATVFANQKQLELQTRYLEQEADRLNRNASEWVELMEKLNDSLKELGDVESWAQAIEKDMKSIAQTAAFIHRTKVPGKGV